MIVWKYTNGSWRVAYWSVGRAPSVVSGAPIAGCRHVAGSAGALLPMSSLYERHVLPTRGSVSWSEIVFTLVGYTQPWPSSWPKSPWPVDVKSEYVLQSACVSEFGAWPLISA